MDPITETFTPDPSPKLPLPQPPSACELLGSAINTCAQREINAEFCHALNRMYKAQCTKVADEEN